MSKVKILIVNHSTNIAFANALAEYISRHFTSDPNENADAWRPVNLQKNTGYMPANKTDSIALVVPRDAGRYDLVAKQTIIGANIVVAAEAHARTVRWLWQTRGYVTTLVNITDPQDYSPMLRRIDDTTQPIMKDQAIGLCNITVDKFEAEKNPHDGYASAHVEQAYKEIMDVLMPIITGSVSGGGYCERLLREPLILEPEDWTEAEWATLCKLLNMNPNVTERIRLDNVLLSAYIKSAE